MPNNDPLDLATVNESASPVLASEFHNLVKVITEKWWVIAGFLSLSLVAAALYVKSAPRVYEATTTIQVEQEAPNVIKLDQVMSEDLHGFEILNTVAQKFSNLALLEQVLDKNHLLPAPGTAVVNDGEGVTRSLVAAKFSRNVKASLRRNTRLIDISVRDTNPQRAATLANSLVDNYIEQDAKMQQKANDDANAFLKQEADQLKNKLEASEEALQDYRKQIGSVSLDQNQDIVTPQLLDLNRRLTQSDSDLVLAQGEYQNALKMGTNVTDLLAYSQIATDSEVVEISTEVAKAENDLAVIRQRYRAKHPKYILAESSLEALQAQLASTVLKVRDRIQESMRIARESDLTAKQGLESQLHDAEAKAIQLSENGVRFNVLDRELRANQALFDAVISRLGETSVASQILPESIRQVQPAEVPEVPASPKIRLVFGLAVFGGLLFGLGASFALGSLDNSLSDPDLVESRLMIPVLSTLPKFAIVDGKNGEALLATDSKGAEYFRALRATLALSNPGSHNKCYLFTSSHPAEGKTFISANYAASLAQQGLRTLLLDFDLRNPMVEKAVTGKASDSPGVADYLSGTKSFEEICQKHPTISKLYYVTGGTPADNPAELIAQDNVKTLLEAAGCEFDRIVIDTAPLLVVGDTLLLLDKAQVILVVNGCKTTYKAAKRSVQLLRGAPVQTRGMILNFLPTRQLHSHYRDSYGYGYAKKSAK